MPDDLPDDHPAQQVIGLLPDHHVKPHNMPVSVEIVGAYDDRGVWWVMYRWETVHGSFVVFATPETAKTIETESGEARAAQLTTPFVPGSLS